MTEDGLQRLALEDGGQALGIYPAAKYNVDSEQVTIALAKLTAAPKVATLNLYQQFLFAWLTGNGDLHAKNVSILRGSDGRWSMSPMYDLPCTVLYRDNTLALPVAGKTRDLRSRHWKEFADNIGLSQAAALAANKRVLKVAAQIDLKELPIQGSPLHGAERELRKRRNDLETK